MEQRRRLFFPLKTREEMDEAHRAYARRRGAPAPSSGPAPLNTQAVLDLGNLVFFTFRGRAYGIPPLGWREGMRLTLLWTEALRYPTPLTPESAPSYYAVVEQLPPLLWSLVRPVGRIRRALKRFRLLRNPFFAASEGELVELAAFFLTRRGTSTIGPLADPTNKSDPRTYSKSSRSSLTISRPGLGLTGSR